MEIKIDWSGSKKSTQKRRRVNAPLTARERLKRAKTETDLIILIRDIIRKRAEIHRRYISQLDDVARQAQQKLYNLVDDRNN